MSWKFYKEFLHFVNFITFYQNVSVFGLSIVAMADKLAFIDVFESDKLPFLAKHNLSITLVKEVIDPVTLCGNGDSLWFEKGNRRDISEIH